MKYLLNYNTGAGNSYHSSPEAAMAACDPNYTQENITVEDESGKVLYRARWIPLPWDVDEEYNNYDDSPGLYADFGQFGHYTNFQNTECEY